MRRAKYDMKQVVCRNASCIGYSSNIARPGYWIEWRDFYGTSEESLPKLGRVIGRIAEHETGSNETWGLFRGYLAVVMLSCEATHAHVAWVNPADVQACYEKPPARLLAWITGDDWVKDKRDIARIIAMSEYGTLSESYISSRDDPDKAYNARPGYIRQFILE